MAAIRQRAGVWQARVRRKGYPDEVSSFLTKVEAQQWARGIEAAIDRGVHHASNSAKQLLFKDVLEQYVREVTPLKRGATREAESIRFMQRHRMVLYSMATLTPKIIAGYRDERLLKVSAGTVIRELSILSSVITHARKEWSLPITNPCALVRKPPTPIGRSRILSIEEETKLLIALLPIKRRSPWMIPIVSLALETAMRRGELLSMRWQDIDLNAQTVLLPMTKNGTTRIVPLSKKAVSILEALPRDPSRSVFPLSFMTLHNCFKHACKRCSIENLHFHDLRHTATSRLATKLPNVIELASVTGHQTIQMLKRYYHPSAEALAKKLG